jgi:hypothetical protein
MKIRAIRNSPIIVARTRPRLFTLNDREYKRKLVNALTHQRVGYRLGVVFQIR